MESNDTLIQSLDSTIDVSSTVSTSTINTSDNLNVSTTIETNFTKTI